MDKLQRTNKHSISGRDSKPKSIVNAIANKNVHAFLQVATIEDEVQKSNCIYDIIHFDGVSPFDIESQITECLIRMNTGLNKNMELTDNMIKMIVDMVLNDFNGLTIPGFFKCMRNGLKGEYGQVYSMNVITVTNWIQKYLENDTSRIDELRRSREEQKKKEMKTIISGDLSEVMKIALKMTEPKPKTYRPKQTHLEQFKEVVKLYTDIEIGKAVNDWSKRQRPEYLEILEAEKASRKSI